MAGIDGAVLQQQRQQRDAEFAADGERDAGAHRLEVRVDEQARGERGDRRALSNTMRDQQREDQPELAPQRVEVEQHAHGDEEQAEQDVAERPDDAFHLVAVFGLGQHHAREEGAQRHREAGHLRGPGRGQRHQQHRQREQLAQPAVGDHVEQRPQQPAARGQHHQHQRGAGGHRLSARRR